MTIPGSVRVRLDRAGLGLNDNGLYKCPALLKNGPWQLRRIRLDVDDPIPWNATWGPGAPPPEVSDRLRHVDLHKIFLCTSMLMIAQSRQPDDQRWVWQYVGPEEEVPKQHIMVEESRGPYERKLLLKSKGGSESTECPYGPD